MKTLNTEEKTSLLPCIVPFIALLATVWLIYKTVSERGVEIVVNFTDGSSLKEGKTFVKYRGFNVGKVTSLTIGKDLKTIDAHIELNHDIANLIAREKTTFWIVEPKVTVSEISGLDTIVSGSYIEVHSKIEREEDINKFKKKFSFKAYHEKPVNSQDKKGGNFILESKTTQDVKKGTLVFYKNIEVGKVIDVDLKEDMVFIYLKLKERYKNLVNSSTKFFTNSGVKIKASLDGVEMNVNSLASIIGGGISFETFDKKVKSVTSKHHFTLYKSKEELHINEEILTFTLQDSKGLKKGSPIIYKGIKVGELVQIVYNKNGITGLGKIKKKYSFLATNNSRFFKAVSNIETLNFNNLETIVKGSFISLDYKKGKPKRTFKLFNSYRELKAEDMIEVKLKANRFSNLNIGSELYYKNIVIGRVVDVEFIEDYQKIQVRVLMEKKYKTLLNDKTLFYIISTPLIESENFDFTLNFERVKPFLFGGIGLEYYPSKKEKRSKYWLYDSNFEMNSVRKTYRKGLRIPLELDNESIVDEDISIVFSGVKIGSVESFNPLSNPPSAMLFIENKYKKYLKKRSKFYLKSAVKVKANFDGIDLSVGKISDLIRGSIVMDNSNYTKDSSLHKNFHYKLYQTKDSFPKVIGKRFTLYSQKGVGFSEGTKVFYKKIEIGKVEKIALSLNAQEIVTTIVIYKKYKNLIRENTIFYNTTGIDIDISLLGADIKADSLQTILKGGVSIAIPDKVGKIAREGKRFKLYQEREDEWLEFNPAIKL